MLVADVPSFEELDERVRSWIKDARELQNLPKWLVDERIDQREFKVPLRRVSITHRLAELLVKELGIDSDKVDTYAVHQAFNAYCRTVIERPPFSRASRGKYIIESPSEQPSTPPIDPNEAPKKKSPVPSSGDPYEVPTQLEWPTLVSGSGDHIVYACSWPVKRKAAVLDEILQSSQGLDFRLEAEKLLTDKDFPVEIKVGYTGNGFESREGDYQQPERANLFVEVRFESEANARQFETALIKSLQPMRLKLRRDWFKISLNDLESEVNKGLRWQQRSPLKSTGGT